MKAILSVPIGLPRPLPPKGHGLKFGDTYDERCLTVPHAVVRRLQELGWCYQGVAGSRGYAIRAQDRHRAASLLRGWGYW